MSQDPHPARPRLALPFGEWPVADRAAWERALRPCRGLFDRDATAAHLRPATLSKTKAGYSIWLDFLARSGWLVGRGAPAARVAPARLDAYLHNMRARGNRPATILGRFRELAAAFRLIEPGYDTTQILRPNGITLRRLIPPVPRTVATVSVHDLLARVHALFEAGCRGASYAQGRTAIRDAALLAILVTRAPRICSLARMELNRHLLRQGDGFEIAFDRDDTKTATPLAWALPSAVAPIVASYLGIVRPAMQGSAATPRLWVGTKGKALNQRAVARIVRRRTAAWFGQAKGPHWFRKCLTTSAADMAPELAFDAAAVMGHTPQVALAHYNKASGRGAAKRHGKRLTRLRRQTASLTRSFYGAHLSGAEVDGTPSEPRVRATPIVHPQHKDAT